MVSGKTASQKLLTIHGWRGTTQCGWSEAANKQKEKEKRKKTRVNTNPIHNNFKGNAFAVEVQDTNPTNVNYTEQANARHVANLAT